MHDFKVFGMIHLPRLTPDSPHDLPSVIEYCVKQARVLEGAGFPAVIVENFNDTPFPKNRVSDVVLSKLAVVIHELRRRTSMDIGVNVLRNACCQAMALATTFDCQYIRCNVWESAYVTDQGIIEGAAHDVMTLKHSLRSEVKVLADVHVKHARPLGQSDVVEAARNALGRGGADHVIVSGVATGSAPDRSELHRLNEGGVFPIIGSGVSADNIGTYREMSSGVIVGTSIKLDGVTTNPVDPERAREFIEALGT